MNKYKKKYQIRKNNNKKKETSFKKKDKIKRLLIVLEYP